MRAALTVFALPLFATCSTPGVREVQLIEQSAALRMGEPVAAVSIDGRRLTVPLWLELNQDNNCDIMTDVLVVPLADGRTYFDQQNINCDLGGKTTCRIIDANSTEFRTPKHCLTSMTGGRYDFDEVSPGWYFVRSYHEGPGTGALVRYDEDRGPEVHLENISEFDQKIRRVDGEFVIASKCDPKEGGCSYKMLMFEAPIFEWSYEPKTRQVRRLTK